MAAFATFPSLTPRLHRSPARSRRRCAYKLAPLSMSGVNGGIDYEINLDDLPPTLRSQVETIQNGPETPDELISAASDIAAASADSDDVRDALMPVLVDMLGYNNPVAARIAIDSLVSTGEASIPVLLTGCGAFNYSVNQYALRALGNIGHPSVHAIVTACAEAGPIPGVRRAACYSLGRLNFTDKPSAEEAYTLLLKIADGDSDWGVRYAAIAGVEKFAAVDLLGDSLRKDGVAVLQCIIEGKERFFKSGEDENDKAQVRVDATVTARATIALEAIQAPVPSA